MVRIFIVTGAKVSVGGVKQAKLCGLLDRLQPSQTKILPYNSQPISVKGTTICSVTYLTHATPVKFFVLPGSSQLTLDGFKAAQLKIITMNKNDTLFNSVKILKEERKGFR